MKPIISVFLVVFVGVLAIEAFHLQDLDVGSVKATFIIEASNDVSREKNSNIILEATVFFLQNPSLEHRYCPLCSSGYFDTGTCSCRNSHQHVSHKTQGACCE